MTILISVGSLSCLARDDFLAICAAAQIARRANNGIGDETGSGIGDGKGKGRATMAGLFINQLLFVAGWDKNLWNGQLFTVKLSVVDKF